MFMTVKKEDLEVADMNVVDFGWTTFRKCNVFKSIIEKEKKRGRENIQIIFVSQYHNAKIKNKFYFQ